ncbi:hypothetical protein KFE94_12265 [bacterium SCSIO 12643]|nr:hypothetical protein KFE94_12265 [bacterium SCSIO 12643]
MKTKQILRIGILMLISIIGAIYSAQAQTATTELKISDQAIYSIKVVKDDEGYTITADTLNGKSERSISVTNFTSAVLEQFIWSIHKEKIGIETLQIQESDKALISLKFIELTAALFNIPQKGQKIANISLNKMVRVKGTKSREFFYVKDAQIVFEDGFIKSIIVYVNIDDTNYIFSNQYGIGVTTRRNITSLNDIYLYNENHTRNNYSINLGEVIEYNRINDIATNDFSPKNQKIFLTPYETESSDDKKLELRKTSSPEIFTYNIFSDVVGLNQNNPNGLIQMEFSKRINIWTQRCKLLRLGGIGGFTHIMPTFDFTKIEQNNREMPLISYPVNDTTVTYYANPLQILRYSTGNVKTELNVLDFEGAAMDIHINGFAGIALTQVNDTILKEGVKKEVDESINSFLTGGNLKFIFNPENKWSYTMIGTLTYIKNLNDQFDYYTLKNSELNKVNNLLLGAELLITWNTNEDNKLFGRFRYNWESNNVYNNYSQFQIGYSIKFKASKPNE